MRAEPPVPNNVVDHPRYGNQPRRNAEGVSPTAHACWRYTRSNCFWTTAIPADTTRQVASMWPVAFYADVIETCRNCERPFLFFAEEQKHWYEELGFGIDSWCVQCVDCRKAEQFLKRTFHRYGHITNGSDLSDDDLVQLLQDTKVLADAGMLSKVDNLRRIANLGKRRIPEHEATRALVDTIAAWHVE